MPSSRFLTLSIRIDDLKKSLLPAKFDPTGDYSPAIFDRTRAFRVLAHAEFESFVEDRALEVIDKAFKNWKEAGVVSTSLLAVVAYRESKHAHPGSLVDAKDDKKNSTLESRVTAARAEYNKYVRIENHGIKEKNILRILMPLGISAEDINASWLGDIDSWATSRGDAAHKSGKLQMPPDPKREYYMVRDILKGFRELDDAMEKWV